MAKAKNIGSVDDIIISDDEQLYEVPSNWAWIKLGGIADVKGGKRVPKGKKLSDDKTEHPYIRVTDMSNGTIDLADIKYVDDEIFSVIHNYTISSKDVYISVAGSIGKIGIIPECLEGANLTENAAKITNIIGTDNKYLMMYLQSDVAQLQMMESTISTTQPKLALFRIENIKVPLPPLAEQKRIVEQIENLFAKLDEAREKAQEAVDSFDNVQSAILYDAFSGRLTESWRQKKNIDSSSWKEYTIQDVCSMKITDGTHKTPTYCEKDEGGYPFISSKDVTTKRICWDNIKYIIPELHDELYARLAPQKDDVLLAKNGTTGVAAIVEDDRVFDIYVTLAVLRPNKDIINPRYLLNIVNSPVCKNQFDEHLTGIGVPNLHLRDIKEVKINVPDLDEQEEVVRLVDTIIEKEQKAAETAEKTIEMIDLMKKSILAKAFRGELGTNIVDEESSIELLKSIIEA